MASTSETWQPTPTCPKAHPLEKKTVAGSWFTASKACSGCGAALTAGAARHSCKACGHHLCEGCAAERSRKMLNEEITLTVYRAAQPGLLPGMGVEEDAWQVRVRRGAVVGELKMRLQELYGLPVALQELRRDADSAPLAGPELLKYDEGDVVYLTSAGGPIGGLAAGLLGGGPLSGGLLGGGGPLGGSGPLGGGPLGGLAEVLQGAAAEAAEAVSGAMAEAAARAEQLERTEYALRVVLPDGGRGAAERRCEVTVMATSRIAEVLEMAKLELNAEDENIVLEFAGERLPTHAPVHALGLRSGDTVLAVPAVPAAEAQSQGQGQAQGQGQGRGKGQAQAPRTSL